MRIRVLVLALVLVALGCKKSKPPPEPLEPIDSQLVPLEQPPSPNEQAPLTVAHVTAADLHVEDAGPVPDAGVDAGSTIEDVGVDAGELDDDGLDAGAKPRACAADGKTITCSASCWCHTNTLATISSLKGLAIVGDALWAVGDRAMLRGDGQRWNELYDPAVARMDFPGSNAIDPQPTALTAVAGAGNDIWAANGNQFLHFDGRSWNGWRLSKLGNLNPVAAMTSIGDDDFWAVGRGGLIAHGDRRTWTIQPSGTTEQLYGVAAASRTDVWAVGTNATVLHFDGEGWKAWDAPAPHDRALFGVWAKEGEVWITGDNGTLLHKVGDRFELVPSGTTYGLFSVVHTPDAVIAVGQLGVVVRSDKGKPFHIEATDVAFNLRAATVHHDRIWVVGDNGVMLWKEL